MKIRTHRFYGYYLPVTFDYKYFGYLISQENNKYIVVKKITKLGIIYEFNYYENKSEVFAKVDGKLFYSFIDEFEDKNDITTFNRTFKYRKYIFVNSELIDVKRIPKK
jgi:hypothetical protein